MAGWRRSHVDFTTGVIVSRLKRRARMAIFASSEMSWAYVAGGRNFLRTNFELQLQTEHVVRRFETVQNVTFFGRSTSPAPYNTAPSLSS